MPIYGHALHHYGLFPHDDLSSGKLSPVGQSFETGKVGESEDSQKITKQLEQTILCLLPLYLWHCVDILVERVHAGHLRPSV